MTSGSLFDRFESLSLGWCDWMLQISWQVALLVAILTLVTRLFRQRSAVFLHALWLLVLLRLVLPPDLSIPTGWGWWLLPPRVASAPHATPEVAAARVDEAPLGNSSQQNSSVGKPSQPLPQVPAESEKVADRDSGFIGPSASEPPQPAVATTVSSPAPPDGPADVANASTALSRWAEGLLLCWLGVSGTLLALLGVGTVRIWKWVYDAEPIDDAELYQLLEGCRRQLGMNRLVELRNSDACTTPVVVGYSQPVILLPRSVLTRLNKDELRAVLLHELNHVVRGDAIINLLQGILGAIYFFHPLVWWANARLRELREEACDEMTVAALEGRRKVYGEAIVKVTEIFGYASPPLALGVMESKSPAHRRLSRILDPQLPAGKRLNLREAGLILMFGIILLPCAGASLPAGDARTTAEPAKEPAVIVKSVVALADGESPAPEEKPAVAETPTAPEKTGEVDAGAAEPAVQVLKYRWQTDRVMSYSVKIEAELSDETVTMTGTPSFRVRWADADRAELVYSGTLSSGIRARAGAPFGYAARPPRHMFPAFGGGGGAPFPSEHALEVDHFGKPRDIRGDSQLPYLLGNLSQLLIFPLPNPPAAKWEDSGKSKLTLLPPEERFPVPRFGPRFGPFARRQEGEELEAREFSRYTLEVDANGPLIKRHYELKTVALVDGEPRLTLIGDFRIRFDQQRGLPSSFEGTLQHVQNSVHAATKIPIVLSATLLPEQPVAPDQLPGTRRGPGFDLPGAEAQSPGVTTETPSPVVGKQPLDPAAIDDILKSLGSGDEEKIRTAVEALGRALPGERQREIAQALARNLTDGEEPVRAAVAGVLADWGTLAESDLLLDALQDDSRNVVRGAIVALGRLREPRAIAPLVELIRRRRERAPAGAALRSIGRPASEAVAGLLSDPDWSTRLEACRILQAVGSPHEIDALQPLAEGDPNILVRRAAGEAIEQISLPASKNPQTE